MQRRDETRREETTADDNEEESKKQICRGDNCNCVHLVLVELLLLKRPAPARPLVHRPALDYANLFVALQIPTFLPAGQWKLRHVSRGLNEIKGADTLLHLT